MKLAVYLQQKGIEPRWKQTKQNNQTESLQAIESKNNKYFSFTLTAVYHQHIRKISELLVQLIITNMQNILIVWNTEVKMSHRKFIPRQKL